MKICQRDNCDRIVTGKNHSVHPKFEVECDECVERARKMGIYRLSVRMKPIFGSGQLYKNWTEENACLIKEGKL